MKISKITQAYFIPEYKKLLKKIIKRECQLRNVKGLRENYKRKHPEASEAVLKNIYPFWFSFYLCRPSKLHININSSIPIIKDTRKQTIT
jgi:hypothetical protein